MPRVPQARLTVVAEFSQHFFLENLAVRADGSMLITVLNRNELWYVPAAGDTLPVQPQLLGNFEFNTTFGRGRFYSINAMRALHPAWFREDLEGLFGY